MVLFLGLFVLTLIGVMLLVYNVEKRYPRDGWRDRPFFVALTGVLAGLLPWTLVTRCVFLYHYFSTIPFVMILTLLLLLCVEKQYPRTWWIKWAWLGASAVVFLLMMPAISGISCTKEYATFIEKVLAPFGKVYYVL
jgi:dolichyl-phosphate-mannose--protein O-mannosyl transferase